MRSFLKKAWSALAVAVLSASAVQADLLPSTPCGPICDPCCNPMPEPCYGYAYNPPVFVNNCCGWFADVDFLYLKPVQEGISFGALVDAALTAQTVTLPELGDSNQIIGSVTFPSDDFTGQARENMLYPKWDWDSGFRVGLGYRLPCDCWEVSAIFTHFNTCCNSHNGLSTSFISEEQGNPVGFGSLRGSVFSPTYSVYADNSPFGFNQVSAEATLKIQWNQVDLTFAREFYVGRCVTLRPHTGLRALFLDEKYEITQRGTGLSETIVAGSVASVREDILNRNNFKGIGVLAGLDMAFDFGCGLAFYGEATGSLNFGKYHTHQLDDASLNIFTLSDSTLTKLLPTTIEIKDDIDTLLPNVDLNFGIRWRSKFNCDSNAFTLKLGWENHVFFGYNRFRNVSSPAVLDIVTNSPTGNLSFYGIVFSAALDF